MENKPGLTNRQFPSPLLVTHKILQQNRQACSPKFARKRTEIPIILHRKIERKNQNIQQITYISPKKYLQKQTIATDSLKSVASVTSFTSFTSYTRNQKNIKIKQPSTCSNQSQKDSTPITPIPDHKTQPIRYFQKAQQIRLKVRSNEQLNDLKAKNQQLNKRLTQLTQKIINLKQQNNYLCIKIQNCNQIILQKNQIINRFSGILKQKQQKIILQQNQIYILNQKIREHQNAIVDLSASFGGSLQFCSFMEQEQRTNHSNYRQPLLQQIQKHKIHIGQLVSKIKYTEIQENMYQKLRYDLKIQMQKNQVFKQQNRKLIAKVQQLLANPNSNNIGRDSLLNNGKIRRQTQFLFQLSPEKSEK